MLNCTLRMDNTLASFTDVLDEEICDSQQSQPISLTLSNNSSAAANSDQNLISTRARPVKGTGQRGLYRSTEEIDPKYRDVFTYPYFNLVQSNVIDDAIYSDKSIVVCAPTGSGKTVIFEMAIVQLLMELEDKQYTEDFKIIYMAPVKALCTERLTEWYPKYTKLGLLCIEATGDTDVDFTQLKPYKIIITTPEKWDMLTRRWRDHRSLVEVIKLFLIDEVHILNDEVRGPVLEAVVSRMKTIESSAQSVHRIEKLQNQLHGAEMTHKTAPSIRFVAVSATVSNPEDVASWLGTTNKPAVFHKFGDECRPVRLKRVVEGYPCPDGCSIFKFDIILNYKLWPIIQKYHSGKPTLIFCNTRKSVVLTAETLSKELTINFSAEQKAKLTALASTIKNKKLQSLVMCGVGCHHAGLLYEERQNIELAFRNRDLPILITTTTLAMGVNLPAHLVIIKNTQQYVNGAYQEYSISTVLQMVGRAGRPQFDTEATAVIMTRLADKARYQALVGGCEPLQSYLHKRLAENLNSEAALGTVGDVAQCVQWLRSTFLYVRAAQDPKKYLNLPQNSPQHLISKKIEELCVRAMNGLASAGLITMDEASCIESTEAGRLMSIFYLDLETMKQLMKIEGTESLDRLLTLICESHELADMHLRVDERRCLNSLNRNNAAATIRFPMKGRITTRQMKLNCIIQAVLGCLAIPDPSLNQEAMKIMRIADRVCKCLVAYVTRPDLVPHQPQFYSAVLNSIILAKCIQAHLWENSPFVSKQLRGIGPTFSTLLATAGKVNFMLLEESHPRDLERIMNKGPPAGNILRKQVSLLPKYQLSMVPLDESTVMLQLVLLNQNFLVDHLEELTAGSTHKSYIIVGDSNNNLLLLVSFKDKDLLSVFDGTISHEIRRKHNYEHKMLAHCISTTFVGIDVHTEYVFNDLNQFFGRTNYNKSETPLKETGKRQTCITDTFKERKRKNTADLDKTQSKEKKKRDNAIIENFKYLKKTFETASKNIKENITVSTNTYKLPNYTLNEMPEKDIVKEDTVNDEFNQIATEMNVVENIDSDDYIDDEKVDNILTEIENEMFKGKINPINNTSSSIQQSYVGGTSALSKIQKDSVNNTQATVKMNCHKPVSDRQKRKPSVKSNYTFIELLERNLDLSDDEESSVATTKSDAFSETIKSQINNYIHKTEKKAKIPNTNLQLLLENEDKLKSNNNINASQKEVLDTEKVLRPTQKLETHYEIKEILGGHNTIGAHTECRLISPEIVDKQNFASEVNHKSYIHTHNNNNIRGPLDNKQNTPTYITNNNSQPKIDASNLSDINVTKEYFQKQINEDNNDKNQNSNTFYVDDFQSKASNGSDIFEDDLKVDSSWDGRSEILCSQLCVGKQKSMGIMENNQNKLDSTATESKNNSSVEQCVNKDSYYNYESKQKATFENDITRIKDSNKAILPYSDNKNTTNLSIRTASESSIVSNQGHCSESNYSTSNFLTDCLHANLSFRSNNSCNEHENNNSYSKNYSYSATKIGIFSKQMPKYSVQVVKKVQVDLNISTLLSTNLSQDTDNNIPNVDIKTVLDNNNAIAYFVQNPEYYKLQNINKLNTINYKDGISNKDLIDEKKKDIGTSLQKLNSIITSKESVSCLPYTQENALQNLCLHSPSDNNIEPKSDANENIEVDVIRTASDRCEIINETSERINQLENVNTNAIETGFNKVQNILKKYSEILTKDSTRIQTSNCPETTRQIALKKTPKPDYIKPFKMCDIQKQYPALPNFIIDCNKHAVGQNVTALTKNAEYEPKDKKYFLPEHYAPLNYSADLIDKDISYQSSADINLEPIQLPDRINLEPVTDVEIDQSMFDPKTLLQCTVDCNEIIPPPPQFSDYPSCSPNYNDIEDLNEASSYSPNEEVEYEHITNKKHNYGKNIFKDQSITDLTPSREIETWTLAEEDSWEDRYSSPNASKSFTVMHKNMPSYCDFSGNSSVSRQAKLGHFKFNQKNKLRKWQ